MNQHSSVVSADLPVEAGRKAWSTPVVSFLAIEETATGITVGNDGLGTSTGS